ncbi:MoaD/ThiS family protein [Thermosediminibacter oceani]|uniref:ThiamineS protein n=1 Tax=Thermosediminibacter oceani (strain ATCC BAA-1034 / DSM 16646 / JW/IW-1228P) TaxID=555079 RepID=D9RYZ4_THEOJ|nr:MoaD/ThiS family protein [Thermosediminibacter oceani]ADL08548.1 thiamineS protein [Thermosediminibacter oceani DSM 16646]
MKVIFRMPFKREVEVKGIKTVRQLAEELKFSLESHLVLRDGKMLTPDEALKEDDVVEVLSAISGG